MSPSLSSGGCSTHASCSVLCLCVYACVCEPYHLVTIRCLSRGPADSHDQLADWTTAQLYQNRPEADGGKLLLRLTLSVGKF